MNGVYNPLLTCLSVVVAFLASYTALEGAATLSSVTSSRWRHVWLAGSACAMGIGIWSMHFIGMIALTLPIAVGYDLDVTAASLALAVLAALVALATVSRGCLSARRLLVAGAVMGMGVAAMHYTGMLAMRMSPSIDYDPARVALSVAIATGASIGALWLAFHLRDSRRENIVWKRLGAAAVMAFAISGMHYTGMSAATFADASRCLSAHKVDASALALIVGVASTVVLIGTLWIFGTQANRLSASLDRATHTIRRLGTHDALTDLPNRAYLMARAKELAQRGALAVLFVDLDGFKVVNDTLGHKIGDDLLRQAAARIAQCAHEGDLVARLGGDEFVVVTAGSPRTRGNASGRHIGNIGDAAETVARRILASLAEEFVLSEALPVRIGASIGIALSQHERASLDTLLSHADCAMYAAKRSGRNTFRCFEDSMGRSTLRSLHIQRDLHVALAREQFDLVFQPKYTVDGKAMTGAQALLRWNHPVLGDVPPLEFIPIAERAGLMIAIGDWVLRRICAHLLEWEHEAPGPMSIAINLSPMQFNLPRIVERIDAIVTAAGVPPERFMFGISEATAMQDVDRTREVVQALRDRGYAVAIDDFGTALSSLGHLQDFRVDQIKIDRAFVSGLDDASSRSSALLSAVMALARVLGIEVVAEGVETVAQSLKLLALDCDQMQGFLCGSPLAGDEFRRAMSGPSTVSLALKN
ncbi:diguanylate cyclase (GGDEF)-like protein [Paraburkholderia bannensis]|uniref:Diguanylate cyclase (GGDEF)-like protein n=1 Tax=Paraburkholderia bannensis TaxID=765414 RepID=A0A7W9WU49_9BURK|nr:MULTISPECIES: EAL domain-containing protein [Paraburkholderia]MBB3258993.1 diguanylate cyclase (GGDEF)-like protein [Paraburkholderia sp. WP4_3_2]MBB6104007.1 diguanylate cyclase (GGDEF)-like protein [Paraburkholderia bannensis]